MIKFWLLGYEFPATLMLFTLDCLYVVTTAKKGRFHMACPGYLKREANVSATAKHLEQLKGGRFPIEILIRGKDAAENEKLWVTIVDKIKAAGVSHPQCIRGASLLDARRANGRRM